MPQITLLEGDVTDNDFHAGACRPGMYSWGVSCEGGQQFLIQDYAGVTQGDIRKLAAFMAKIFSPVSGAPVKHASDCECADCWQQMER
jgi:hypothetical protein